MNPVGKWILIALAIEVVILIVFSIINKVKTSNLTITVVHDEAEPDKVGLYLSAKTLKDLEELGKYTKVSCQVKVIHQRKE